MASATGESSSARGFSCQAATRKRAMATRVKIQAKVMERAPVASARILVRGFSLSKRRSAMRLMVMAAERAETMATTIQRIWRKVGQPCEVKRAARSAPVRAKGKAKMECSNLIISRTVRMRPAIADSGPGFLCFGMGTGRAVHFLLPQADLREHGANMLVDEIVAGAAGAGHT